MKLPKFTLSKPCKKCDAICCKYITIEIDTPKTTEDFQNIRWYVAHKNLEIIAEEDGSWWIKFITPCKKLNQNYKCNIYKKRPSPCKDFSAKTCPFHDKNNESLLIFKEIKTVDKYIKNIFKKGRHTTK